MAALFRHRTGLVKIPGAQKDAVYKGVFHSQPGREGIAELFFRGVPLGIHVIRPVGPGHIQGDPQGFHRQKGDVVRQ